jgi:hypothetical protein
MALKDAARTWFMNVMSESVTSWTDQCRQFVANFMPTYELSASKNDLKVVRQYKGEALRHYIHHFSQIRIKIPHISNKEDITAFFAGVADIKMKEKFSINNNLTFVVRLFEIADMCTKVEEGRLFIHAVPEAAPVKAKSKETKRKEVVVLWAKPNQKHHHDEQSERDKGDHRHLSSTRGTQTTPKTPGRSRSTTTSMA